MRNSYNSHLYFIGFIWLLTNTFSLYDIFTSSDILCQSLTHFFSFIFISYLAFFIITLVFFSASVLMIFLLRICRQFTFRFLLRPYFAFCYFRFSSASSFSFHFIFIFSSAITYIIHFLRLHITLFIFSHYCIHWYFLFRDIEPFLIFASLYYWFRYFIIDFSMRFSPFLSPFIFAIVFDISAFDDFISLCH